MEKYDYKKTMFEWTDTVNMYNIRGQMNIIFRIIFNILWVLVVRGLMTKEQVDSLVKLGD